MKLPSLPLGAKKPLFRLAIFLSPFFALTFFTLLFGYAPLGEIPAAASGDAQYLSYLSSLHSAIKGDGFFSFAELATDASHLHARYAGSPFTWLNALFPISMQEAAAFLLLAVKSGLAALSFSFCLERRRPALSASFTLILSFSYALIACIGLSDGLALLPEQLILLPLLLLSLESFFTNGKNGLLLFSLAFVFLTGYTVAYATVFFALLGLLLAMAEGRVSLVREKASAFKLVYTLLVSLLFALPILLFAIPNLLAIGQVNTYSGSFVYRLPLLLLGFWPGANVPEFPTFYVGLLPLLLLPLFFACKAFSRRYRLSFGAILLLFCTYFFFCNPFGGALGFGLSFFVLLLTADLLSTNENFKKLLFSITAALLLLMPMLLQKFAYTVPSDGKEIEILMPIFGVYIPLCLLFFASLTLSSLLERKNAKKALTALLIVVLLADGFAATFWRTSGKTFLETEKQTIADADETLTFLFGRADATPSQTERVRLLIANPLKNKNRRTYLLGSQDQRALSPALASLIASFGGNKNASEEDAPLPFLDAVLGSAYVMKDENASPLSSAYSDLLYSHNGYSLYKTPALPTVFAASADILTFKADEKAPFKTSNQFISALLGEEIDVYLPLADVTVTKEDNTVTWNGTAPVSGTVCYYGNEIGSKNLNVTVSNTSYRPYENGLNSGILLFEHVESGHAVTATQNRPSNSNENRFYISDDLTLKNAIGRLQEKALSNVTLNGNTLKGDITLGTDERVIMTTLPYDADYRVTLDGKAAQTASVEGLLAIHASEGTHSITVERPTSFGVTLMPCAIGLCGACVALVLLLVQKNRKKQGKVK